MATDTLIRFFFDLVCIDSPSCEEENVRNYIKSKLAELEIENKIDRAGNLFAFVKGSGEPVLLSAHMDTVEPGRVIKPFIKNGVIKSDGRTILGADNKVSIAAILAALNEVKEKRRSLELVFSVREETDGGINEFDFSKIKSKRGVVADRASPIGTIVISSPWIENLNISLIGKAAHSGMPEMGVNALSATARALSKLTWGRVDKVTTSNIGLINGGSAMNTVPEKVELVGEVRSFSFDSLTKQLKKVEKVFNVVKKETGVRINLKPQRYCSGYVYKEDERAVEEIKKALGKVRAKPQFVQSFGGSDANTFIANGINVVNIGDGSKNPHSTKEEISIANLIKLKNFFVSYITAI